MLASPEVVVTPTARDLERDVAGRTVAALVTAQSTRRLAHLLLTGGSIVKSLAALRDSPARDSVDWSRVAVWWGDERFVPADSDERNDKPAFAALFDAVRLDPANIHRMSASDGAFGADVDAAAEGYARELAAAASDEPGEDVPHFDVALLGMGPDGHCASLFPEHPGVYEEEAAVIAVRNSPKPPPTRLSLTFRALNSANEVWFVASGREKAHAAALALGGAGRVQIPSAGVRGRFRTLWLLDREAASRLPQNLATPPVA